MQVRQVLVSKEQSFVLCILGIKTMSQIITKINDQVEFITIHHYYEPKCRSASLNSVKYTPCCPLSRSDVNEMI